MYDRTRGFLALYKRGGFPESAGDPKRGVSASKKERARRAQVLYMAGYRRFRKKIAGFAGLEGNTIYPKHT